MTKPKHKQPPKNFLRYLLDEYILFRRDFAFETTASVEDCAKQLRELSYEKQGCWRGRISSEVNYTSNTPHFKIMTEHSGEDGDWQSANVDGIIEYQGDGTTLINGTVLMSGWQFWLGVVLLGCMLMIFQYLNNLTMPLWMFLPFVGLLTFSWVQMYSDRNYLIQQIEQAVRNAEMEANLSKVKNEQITPPYDDSSEYQSHQSEA